MQKSQFLVFGLLFALPSCSQGSGGAQYDSDALSALYTAMYYAPFMENGDDLSYSYQLMNWMDGSPCTNSWTGVACEVNGRVTSLDLSNMLITIQQTAKSR